MGRRQDPELLADIREATSRILIYTAGMTYEDFLRDIKTQDAEVRNIEIIGEAARGLSDGFRQSHPSLEWKAIAGMRDRPIHQYFGVNLDIVWNVVQREVHDLRDILPP